MKTRKKILIIIPSITHGGIEYQSLIVARNLKHIYDFETTLVGLGKVNSFRKVCEKEEVNYKSCLIRANKDSSFYNKIIAIFRFTKMIYHERPHAILGTTTWINTLCAFASFLLRTEIFIWAFHSLETNQPTKLEFLACKLSRAKYVAVSKTASMSAQRKFSILPEAIHIIPNSIYERNPKRDRTEWRLKLGIQENCFLFLKIANFFPEKDYDTVVDAAFKLLECKHENIHFLFVGSAPGMSTAALKIKEKIFDQKKSQYFTIISETEDITGLILAADMGIFSSKSESFGLVLLEYLFNGLPCLISDIPTFHEILSSKFKEIFFEIGDHNHLCYLMDKSIINSAWRTSIVKNLSKDISCRYNNQVMTNGYAALL